MSEGKNSSKDKETVSTETESVEPASGEMTEDELDQAVGGVGTVDEQPPLNTGDSAGRGWWNDPNE
ncbi:MAG: hypothetical protein OXM03_13800 [Chloroflexota bacterium]|nr:hypothetical protein [Chloroflexota bacterium]MDE2841694.1 hypothetical protein [Chloroflexota bacterium]MDE2930825.1 hypothetical protein [Chloroflexota bacterium]